MTPSGVTSDGEQKEDGVSRGRGACAVDNFTMSAVEWLSTHKSTSSSIMNGQHTDAAKVTCVRDRQPDGQTDRQTDGRTDGTAICDSLSTRYERGGFAVGKKGVVVKTDS